MTHLLFVCLIAEKDIDEHFFCKKEQFPWHQYCDIYLQITKKFLFCIVVHSVQLEVPLFINI
ncbi:hypothetical protein BpHYR1_002603 [Brachionus plicatilis]|uniref:Uncharacterized protein n=1 Tax=Brachionus plicatilis TaxID=10195 RepID=A0A3M7PS03_BRAPC|nr:hypothetical protein BpHYR1_002603 [Brachionus plicatilis]